MMDVNVPADEVEAFLLGKAVLAAGLARRCDDSDRAVRMGRAVERFCEQVGVASGSAALAELQRRSFGWGALERRLLLVDLWSVDPFSPYEIKTSVTARRSEVQALGTALDAAGVVAEIERCARELRAGDRLKVGARVGGAVVAGALASGGLAFVAAPLIGTAVGAGMGLSGAAATSAGLSLLGGGSLAAGGAGMVGGVLAVSTTGAALGGMAGGGGTALHQLGARQAQAELRKLELKFKVALLQTQGAQLVAQRFAQHVHDEVVVLRERLADERRYSDQRSARIDRLEKLLRQFESTESWMTAELDGGVTSPTDTSEDAHAQASVESP